ncbi:hypothetical protein SLE2022_092670 [Rubroshorea leprosula]
MAAAKTSSASAPNPKPKTRILKPTPVSPQLSQFLGTSEASCTEAIKKIWDYVKLHNPLNPANKREIQCDEKLKTIFDGKDKVGFPEVVAKLLSHHFMKSG